MGSAFSGGGLLLQLAAALLLVAALGSSIQRLRLGMAAAGAVGALAFVLWLGEPVAALWSSLVAFVSLGQVLLVRSRDRRIRFNEEEGVMVETGLPRLTRTQARHFIDQGMWIAGATGETLTREGEPVSHLFFLSRGSARVLNGGVEIATLAAPAFIGEITVLARAGATGTVVLAGPARFWCMSAEALHRLLAEDAELGTVLENSFAGSVSAKLRLSNRLLAEHGPPRQAEPVAPISRP